MVMSVVTYILLKPMCASQALTCTGLDLLVRTGAPPVVCGSGVIMNCDLTYAIGLKDSNNKVGKYSI